MENTKNNSREQEEKDENAATNDHASTGDDTLGENTEVTPLGEELEEDKEEENDSENPVNDGKAAKDPAPDDDAQLDIETVSP